MASVPGDPVEVVMGGGVFLFGAACPIPDPDPAFPLRAPSFFSLTLLAANPSSRHANSKPLNASRKPFMHALVISNMLEVLREARRSGPVLEGWCWCQEGGDEDEEREELEGETSVGWKDEDDVMVVLVGVVFFWT